MATKDKLINLEDLKVLSDHVEGEVTDLKSDINNSTSNLAADAVTLNGYYIGTSGDISPLASGRNNSTIYLEAQPNKRYLIKKTNDTMMRVGLGTSAGLTSGRLTQYSYYLEGESDTTLYVTTTDTHRFIYVMLFSASTTETIAKNIATLAIVEDLSTELSELNNEVSTAISSLNTKVDTLRNDVFVDGNVISVSSANMNHNAGDANITFESSDSFSYARVSAVNNQIGFTFDTEPQKEYTLTALLKGVSGGYVNIYICPTATYDTGKALTSSTNITTDSDISLTFTATTAESSIWFMVRYNVPAINVTGLYCSDGVLRFKYNMMEYNGEDISTFNKILCIGDSITEGTFNYTQGGSNENVITIPKYSYPTQLKKITGCDTVNMGHGGYTAVEWYARHSEDDLSGYDCAIIGFGINDSLESVSMSDFTSAYHSIIDKLETANKGIKVFLLTITPAYTDYNRRYDTYNAEIRRIAEEDYINAYLVDMTQYSICKYGTAYAQGHLTALGYMQMASEIKTMISYIIHSNPAAFRNVQFIGTDYTYTEES